MSITHEESGFTMVELIIASAIVGILALLAVPALAQLKYKAYNDTSVTDLKNSLTDQSAIYFENSVYVDCDGKEDCEAKLIGAKVTEGITVFRHSVTMIGGNRVLTASVNHPGGSNSYMFMAINGKEVLPITPI